MTGDSLIAILTGTVTYAGTRLLAETTNYLDSLILPIFSRKNTNLPQYLYTSILDTGISLSLPAIFVATMTFSALKLSHAINREHNTQRTR